MSSLGYRLRRQIRSWLGIDPKHRGGLEGWLRDAQNSNTLGVQLDRAEQLMGDMLSTADEASEGVAEQLQNASVYFLAGTSRLNQYASTSRPTRGSQVMRWAQMREDAEGELIHCVQILEADIIKASLLNAEKRIAEQRHEADPMNKFATLVEKHLHKGKSEA